MNPNKLSALASELQVVVDYKPLPKYWADEYYYRKPFLSHNQGKYLRFLRKDGGVLVFSNILTGEIERWDRASMADEDTKRISARRAKRVIEEALKKEIDNENN